jgi:hypothetical protein
LPTIPVAYRAAWSCWAIVTSVRSSSVPGRVVLTSCLVRASYRLVSKPAQLGLHTQADAYPSVYRTPLAASESQ